MKSRGLTVFFFLSAMSIFGQTGAISLDEAIQNASLKIQDGLNKGSTVIVYQFQSDNPRLSDYVLKELFDKLVNARKFVVLDRGDALKAVDAELDFQYVKSAGMISDDSLSSLTIYWRWSYYMAVFYIYENLDKFYQRESKWIGYKLNQTISEETTYISFSVFTEY